MDARSKIFKEIDNALTSQHSDDKKVLWQKFQKELVSISGEFHEISKKSSLVDLISGLLQEEKSDSIAICSDGLVKIVKPIKNLNIVEAFNLEPEHKKSILARIPVAMAKASYVISETGSVVVIYDETPVNIPLFLAEVVVILVNKENIVKNLPHLFEKVNTDQTSNMVFISGPSRTADIEKVLVLGAHGPRRLVVCSIENKLWATL